MLVAGDRLRVMASSTRRSSTTFSDRSAGTSRHPMAGWLSLRGMPSEWSKRWSSAASEKSGPCCLPGVGEVVLEVGAHLLAA